MGELHILKIESVEDYKLYLRKVVNEHTKDKEKQKEVIEMLLECFYDGMKFAQNRLEVEL